MKAYKADLHIHSVLSPCGSLHMSPVNIINRAAELKLDLIGISDHNSSLHGELMQKLGKEKGIMVLTGAEVTTKEEVHCLTFFENIDKLQSFQKLLEQSILRIPNKPDKFGYQVVVDEAENILEEIDYLLIAATNLTISELATEVHKRNGLFIPAHIDRPAFSLMSQLGFIPEGLEADALELSAHAFRSGMAEKLMQDSKYSFITSSDAHHPEQIGSNTCRFYMNDLSFDEVRKALRKESGRRVEL